MERDTGGGNRRVRDIERCAGGSDNRVDAGNRNRAAVGQDDAPATGIVNYDIAHRSRADVDCTSNRSTVSIAERQTKELIATARLIPFCPLVMIVVMPGLVPPVDGNEGLPPAVLDQ